MLQNKDGKNISFSSVKVIVTTPFSFGTAVNHRGKTTKSTTECTEKQKQLKGRIYSASDGRTNTLLDMFYSTPINSANIFLFVLRDKV